MRPIRAMRRTRPGREKKNETTKDNEKHKFIRRGKKSKTT